MSFVYFLKHGGKYRNSFGKKQGRGIWLFGMSNFITKHTVRGNSKNYQYHNYHGLIKTSYRHFFL